MNSYIEKYNNLKIELTDQLDGKSDMMHNVEDDLQNTINILKEQIGALEAQVEEQKQEITTTVDKLNEKEKETEKLYNEIMVKNERLLAL